MKFLVSGKIYSSVSKANPEKLSNYQRKAVALQVCELLSSIAQKYVYSM